MTRTFGSTTTVPGDALVLPTAPGHWRIMMVASTDHRGNLAVTTTTTRTPVDASTLDPDTMVLPDHDFYVDAVIALADSGGLISTDHLTQALKGLRRRVDAPRPTAFQDCPYVTHRTDTDLSGYVVHQFPRGSSDYADLEVLAYVSDPTKYMFARALVDGFRDALGDNPHDLVVTWGSAYRDVCWHP